jgi:hypothetical protein
MNELHSGLCPEVSMFTRIDLCEPTLPQQLDKPIMPDLLPYAPYLFCHVLASFPGIIVISPFLSSVTNTDPQMQ